MQLTNVITRICELCVTNLYVLEILIFRFRGSVASLSWRCSRKINVINEMTNTAIPSAKNIDASQTKRTLNNTKIIPTIKPETICQKVLRFVKSIGTGLFERNPATIAHQRKLIGAIEVLILPGASFSTVIASNPINKSAGKIIVASNLIQENIWINSDLKFSGESLWAGYMDKNIPSTKWFDNPPRSQYSLLCYEFSVEGYAYRRRS